MALTKEQTQHLYHKLLDMQKELSGEKKETESMTEEVGSFPMGLTTIWQTTGRSSQTG